MCVNILNTFYILNRAFQIFDGFVKSPISAPARNFSGYSTGSEQTPGFFVKAGVGENFNPGNTWRIVRINSFAGRRDW